MNLGPTDRHITRGYEAQLHPVSFDFQHNYLYVLTNENSLLGFSAKNQHVPSLQYAPGQVPHFDGISFKPEGS